jgi:3,4-dihydroxy 2-butanone 4-phosphate synthase/GTP cyclohydrolase II
LQQYKISHEANAGDVSDLNLTFKMDEKDYGVGAQILRDLGIRKMRLISNQPQNRTGMVGYGLEIVEHVPVD